MRITQLRWKKTFDGLRHPGFSEILFDKLFFFLQSARAWFSILNLALYKLICYKINKKQD